MTSILLGSALLAGRVQACSFVDPCDEKDCYFFFNRELVDPHVKDFPYRFDDFAVHGENIGEWSRFLEDALSTELLTKLLFEMHQDDYRTLAERYVDSQKKMDPNYGPLLEALREVPSRKVMATLHYLEIASETLPFSRFPNEDSNRWTPAGLDNMKKDEVVKNALMTKLAQAQKEKIPFLRERYLFLQLRVLFYSGDFDELVPLYERKKEEFNVSPSIRYRSQGYYAGALQRSGKEGPAAYMFSRIFSSYPPMSFQAYTSFKLTEEKEWSEALKLTQDTKEKIGLWTLLGMKKDAGRAIQEIYALKPDAPELEPLLAQEIYNLEDGMSVDDESEMKPVPADFLKTLQKIEDEAKVRRPFVWMQVGAYLNALAGRASEAELMASRAEKISPATPEWSHQLARTRLLAVVRKVQRQGFVDTDSGMKIAAAVDLLSSQRSSREEVPIEPLIWARNVLSRVFFKNGDLLRADLLQIRSDNSYLEKNENVDKALALLMSSSPRGIDAYIVAHGAYGIGELHRLKAYNFFFSENYTSAVSLMPDFEGMMTLPADPFTVRMVDCHDCDHVAGKGDSYSRDELIKKMAELQKKTLGGGQEGAQANFDLATAWYNISYFGNCRAFYNDNFDQWSNPQVRRRQKLAVQISARLYRRAKEMSSDPEFAAKALYLQAKSEHAARAIGEDDSDEIKSFSGAEFADDPQFQKLKNYYATTQFYKEALQECSFLRQAVAPKTKRPQ